MTGADAMVAAVAQPPAFTLEMGVIFAIIAIALLLFVWEPIPIDLTAILIMVALIVLGPWTGLSVQDGLLGFASPATITVLAMFVLSEGVRRTGLLSVLGEWIATRYGTSSRRQLLALLGISGGSAGIINNTPVVAVMIPMVSDIADRTGVSPSKLLLPISYASMMGGMLTLIGTSTNLLASDVYASMGAEFEPFTFFEFTALGAIVLVVGVVYLYFIGDRLLPARIEGGRDLTAEFGMAQYLTEVTVKPGSSFVGKRVEQCLAELDVDIDIIQLIRENRAFTEPLSGKEVRANDVLVLRTNRSDLVTLIEAEGLALATADDERVPDETLTAETEELDEIEPQELVEVVIAPDAPIVGRTLKAANFRQRYDASVLAIRRGEKVIHARMEDRSLRGGDTLLIQATEDTIRRFTADRNFVVAGRFDLPAYREEKLPIALAIIFGVVAVAGIGLTSIVVAALAGMVAMVVSGCLRPGEVYESVDWNVIFLLAGLIPLGIAMTRTGAADFLAGHVVASLGGTHPILLLGAFYVFTALLTNMISNNATVVLMIPVAVDVAVATALNPFSFVLAVTFAASTAFMTPMGYQTNLMVYSPGGYTFGDFVRVGGPLQLLMAIVTTLGIVFFWGI